jgi:probable Rubsico expression protein CbbX
MPGLTKRNLIAILIIIAFVTVSVLAWFYFPVVVFPLILALGAFGLAMYVALYPPGTGRVRTAAGRFPAVRIVATADGPAPGRRVPAREAAPRPAARGAGRGGGRSSGGQAAPLPPDAVVALTDERAVAGVDEVVAVLDRTLVGLVPVKFQFEQIASLLVVDRARRRFGLDAQRPNLHMCFTGDPGTGKTTVALQMAELLHRMGYLETAKVVHAMRDDLVGEYIGQTAPKTRWVLEHAMGGVLFIDEAYSLYRPSDPKDFGQESIDILMQVMENKRDKLVVIMAGYKDRMDVFFDSNPGMNSRIAHHLDFAPYTLDELMAIGQMMLADALYYLSDPAEAALREQLSLRMREPRFANARSVRNDLERARLRHAHRLASDPGRSRSRDELMRLEPSDVLSTGTAG